MVKKNRHLIKSTGIQKTQSDSIFRKLITQEFLIAQKILYRQDIRLAAATTPEQRLIIGGDYGAFCRDTGSLLIASDDLADIITFFRLDVQP